MNKHSLLAVASSLLALCLGAGCASPTESAKILRIGLEAPLSGSQSALGRGMLLGAQLAARALNESGGVLGRRIEIVPIDDKADPAVGLATANAALDAGLDAVVGPYNSGVGLQTLPRYLEAGLVPLRLTSSDQTAGLGFTLQPMTAQIAPVATRAIVEWLDATRVALIVDGTTAYNAAAADAMRTLLGEAGVTITSSVAITPGASSYAAAVAEALVGAPDAVYVVAYYPEAGLVAKAMKQAATPARCLADYGAYEDGFIAAAGLEAARACPVVGVPAPGDFPGSASLVSAYVSMHGVAPDVWSPYTYDSVMLLADAITRAGGTSTEPLANALAATTGWRGWTGAVSFERTTGNRLPAPVTVNVADAQGAFHVDLSWAIATGFSY